MEQVTPMLEHIPERSYIRVGSKIECFEVLERKGGVDMEITISKDPIFEINLPTKEIAGMLMKDLYYGEYTGG